MAGPLLNPPRSIHGTSRPREPKPLSFLAAVAASRGLDPGCTPSNLNIYTSDQSTESDSEPSTELGLAVYPFHAPPRTPQLHHAQPVAAPYYPPAQDDDLSPLPIPAPRLLIPTRRKSRPTRAITIAPVESSLYKPLNMELTRVESYTARLRSSSRTSVRTTSSRRSAGRSPPPRNGSSRSSRQSSVSSVLSRVSNVSTATDLSVHEGVRRGSEYLSELRMERRASGWSYVE